MSTRPSWQKLDRAICAIRSPRNPHRLHRAARPVRPRKPVFTNRSIDIMAEAAIPLLNMVILGSFMAGGVAQLNKLGAAAIEDDEQ